jgi:hypothetical protein
MELSVFKLTDSRTRMILSRTILVLIRIIALARLESTSTPELADWTRLRLTTSVVPLTIIKHPRPPKEGLYTPLGLN